MGRNQYWAGRVYDLCVYYMTGTPEGSTESGFMEKPGFEPATPGLQKNFLWLSLGRNQYRREGLWFVCLLYDESTRRLTESGFMWFYVFYGEAGNRTCDPWFTRHSAYPLHHGGFSKNFFMAFLGINQFRRVGLKICVGFYNGNTQRLTESCF